MRIITRNGKGSEATRTYECDYEFGSDLPDMVKKWGDAVVFSYAQDAMVIALQAKIRAAIKGTEKTPPMNDLALDAMVKAWKPSIGRVMDPEKRIENLKGAFAKLPADIRAAMLKELAGESPVPTNGNKPAPTRKGRKAA